MTRRRIPIDDVARIVREWPTATGYAQHIARTYDVPLPTAYRWIAETRRRGLLPQGGEHPCPTCKGTGVRRWGKQESDRRPTGRAVQVTDEVLRDVAEIYRREVTNNPTKVIAGHLGVADRTARLYVRRARDAGLLGEALQGKAGEFTGRQE